MADELTPSILPIHHHTVSTQRLQSWLQLLTLLQGCRLLRCRPWSHFHHIHFKACLDASHLVCEDLSPVSMTTLLHPSPHQLHYLQLSVSWWLGQWLRRFRVGGVTTLWPFHRLLQKMPTHTHRAADSNHVTVSTFKAALSDVWPLGGFNPTLHLPIRNPLCWAEF